MLETALQAIATYVTPYSEASYVYLEDEAKERIPRDPDDWYTVALAIHLDLAIWTQDSDFFGCGCPTWTTDTIMAKLKRNLG
ncbi:MAG: hypothetical protein KME17_19995 [Cyanosarcina radialis HA8281-LM2]|nr:hypothetical protein [Cyanosarcina radialis HA8281-LM2]